MYPFQRSPFLKVEQPAIPETILGTCPVTDKILREMPKEFNEMLKFFYKYFKTDGAFYNIVQNDLIIEWMTKTIVEMCKNKTIRPAANYPYKYLIKRMENSRKIVLTEFLVQEKIYTKQQMDDMLRRFDQNIDAKEKIENYLKGIGYLPELRVIA